MTWFLAQLIQTNKHNKLKLNKHRRLGSQVKGVPKDNVVHHNAVGRASIAFREHNGDARDRVPGTRGEHSGRQRE